MNEHDLAVEFRAKTTEQLSQLVTGFARLEARLDDWQKTGCPFGMVTRAKVDAISDKGFLGKVLGVLVAIFGGIFGRRG